MTDKQNLERNSGRTLKDLKPSKLAKNLMQGVKDPFMAMTLGFSGFVAGSICYPITYVASYIEDRSRRKTEY